MRSPGVRAMVRVTASTNERDAPFDRRSWAIEPEAGVDDVRTFNFLLVTYLMQMDSGADISHTSACSPSRSL